MIIFGVDPGTDKSAYVIFETDRNRIKEKGICQNGFLLALLKSKRADVLIIEQIKSYGMPMGDTTISTCVWIGRFIQAWPNRYELMPRKTICSILCNSAKANDSHIRQRLIDYFGPGKDRAIGKKSSPGPLWGFSRDMWSALAVVIAWNMRQEEASKHLADALT